jgi:hypothetical protein
MLRQLINFIIETLLLTCGFGYKAEEFYAGITQRLTNEKGT